MSLPLYEFIINENDETGVTAVALVDDPAIKINWQAFNNKQVFKTIDTEKRIISGPLMVADMKIYRRDEDKGEYLCVFRNPTIEKIVDKYHRNAFEKNVNPMHNSMSILPDIYMISDFRIDSARGINTPKGYDELPDGSWFADFKVNNDEVWNEYVKTGIFKGFSVEGLFDEIKVPEQPTEQQMQIVSEIFLSLI